MSFISTSFKNSIPLNKICILPRELEKRKIKIMSQIFLFDRKLLIIHVIHKVKFPNLDKTSRSHYENDQQSDRKIAKKYCGLLCFPKVATAIFLVLLSMPN